MNGSASPGDATASGAQNNAAPVSAAPVSAAPRDGASRGARTASEREWARVRGELRRRRFELALTAAQEYPAASRVAGTPLLAAPRWIPPRPLPLADVAIDLDPGTPAPTESRPGPVTGRGPSGEGVRPLRADGRRYEAYTAVMAELDRPAVFADLPTYRLREADLSLPGGRGRLAFGLGSYFDAIDVGEACAHEFAARELGARPDTGGSPAATADELPLRRAVGEPWDLLRRPANLAISTLTIRLDRSADRTPGSSTSSSILLHRRDPAKVGHAGGLLQVVPAGIFQPSGPADWNVRNDFDLWRCITREYSEELLGTAEEYGSDQRPIAYDAWPFAAELTRATRSGDVRVSVLGLGVDPLTFATDLLVVAVFEAPVFDTLFAGLVTLNSEGTVLAGVPFTAAGVERLVGQERVQAAGAALIALAWQHRDELLA
ncbi:transcriptional regulator [Parafrankia sp. EUN1f]|uniref:transcriptional regulator n=1 Tax=Parafrankia sp. EUN1f TaxID=102897 RepID=UPI001E445A5C|nr:transcriptional regulator [Parafrankia sp. EUN1f]